MDLYFNLKNIFINEDSLQFALAERIYNCNLYFSFNRKTRTNEDLLLNFWIFVVEFFYSILTLDYIFYYIFSNFCNKSRIVRVFLLKIGRTTTEIFLSAFDKFVNKILMTDFHLRCSLKEDERKCVSFPKLYFTFSSPSSKVLDYLVHACQSPSTLLSLKFLPIPILNLLLPPFLRAIKNSVV